MKRFWRKVTVEAHEGGYRVLLDGRPVRTQERNLLVLPTSTLADRTAAEWRAQRDEVQPLSMPLTRLASTVIDRLPARRADAVNEVHGYAQTDLLCYRADQPVDLVVRQAHLWQPPLDWMAAAHGCRLEVTTGILPLSQPAAALDRARDLVEGLDDWDLVGVHAAATALGSIVLALALHAGRLDPAAALEAALLDERFVIERWGEEEEQRRRHARLKADVEAATRFIDALRRRPS